MFGSILEEQSIDVRYPDIPEYETMEKLSKEKSVLGVYVSGHPFEKFLPYFKDKTFNCMMLNAFTENEETGEKTYTEISDGQQITMGGMISTFKKLKTRTGSIMAFVTVEDLYGAIECVCFPKVYERIKNFLVPDRVVSLSGKISVEDEKQPSIIIDRMDEFTLEEESPAAHRQQTGGYAQSRGYDNTDYGNVGYSNPPRATKTEAEKKLWLNVSDLDDEDIEELLETLTFYEGDTVVWFVKDGKKMLCSQKVSPNKGLMAELASFLSENHIKLV